jgi:hypothetical protein
MKIVTDTWRQLVQRRLWPVALLLLGALVAVPFFLSKPAEPIAALPPASPANGVKADAASADPIVAPVSDEDALATRRALGVRHDPFGSSAPKSKHSKATHPQVETTPAPTPSTGGGSPSSGGGQAPVTPRPTTPKTPTETIPAYSIDVRFGSSSDGELPRQTLQRNEALPDDNDPVLVYLGVKNGGKTAVFMLSEGLTPTGDGVCTPKDTCETIELKAGETEFFDLEGDTDATQFQLDVVKIHEHATKVPATDTATDGGSGTAAPVAATASVKAGSRAVRARVAAGGPLPYRFDPATGTLRRRH